MKTIDLIAVGGLKFAGLKDLEKKYLQTIRYYVKFQLLQTKEVKHPDERLLMEKEGQLIRSMLMPKDLVIALDRQGEELDTIRFAAWLERQISFHSGRIVFLIGGFAGLAPSLDNRINLKLSFSRLTFPHDLFRILFLEQLYRALTIIHGVKYHR